MVGRSSRSEARSRSLPDRSTLTLANCWRRHRRWRCRDLSNLQLLHTMRTADVVLIGGGIVGSSIAYHLVAAGCKNVLVIERETAQGKGSTGKSMGGVRAQFSTPVNIQMSLYSIPFYASFEDRLGYPCDYRPQGYLFCATNEKHMAYLRANHEKQVAMGLKNVRLVDSDEIRSLFPQLRADDHRHVHRLPLPPRGPRIPAGVERSGRNAGLQN